MKIYISIPIEGHNIDVQKKKVDNMVELLKVRGNDPVNPFEICDDNLSYAECMGFDITALLGCDAVYFCKDWEKSRGCMLEFAAAKIYNKKIIMQ